MNIEIHFKGRYQCRLATDPDDYQDPRGQEGWTFAMPGEPDLDRIIRFRDAVAPRSHVPGVGVRVTSVSLDGQNDPGHPLVGAAVTLEDNPVYEGHNGEIAASAQEPIAPWRLLVSGAGIRLEGVDPIDLTDAQEIARRQPSNFTGDSAEALTAAGIGDPAAYRQTRTQNLQADLAAEADPTRRQALQLRLKELAFMDIREASLGFQLDYAFDIRGPNSIHDPANLLGLPPAAAFRWNVRFWMGAWDADALCGFVKGALSISH